jgi:hypothetical protein
MNLIGWEDQRIAKVRRVFDLRRSDSLMAIQSDGSSAAVKSPEEPLRLSLASAQSWRVCHQLPRAARRGGDDV